jgi:hypothetical protein
VLLEGKTTPNAVSRRTAIDGVLCISRRKERDIALLHGIDPLLVSCVDLAARVRIDGFILRSAR